MSPVIQASSMVSRDLLQSRAAALAVGFIALGAGCGRAPSGAAPDGGGSVPPRVTGAGGRGEDATSPSPGATGSPGRAPIPAREARADAGSAPSTSPSDDAGSTRPLEAPPVPGLADALLGDWQVSLEIGNCIDRRTLLRFMPGGLAESLVIDNDACYPEQRGTWRTPASYSLSGRALTLVEPGARSRFNVAVSRGLSPRRLRRHVLVADGAREWQGEVIEERQDTQGNLLSRSLATVRLRLAAPLPLDGSGACSVSLEYAVEGLTVPDAAGASSPAVEPAANGAATAVACTYGPDALGQRIDVAPFELPALDDASRVALEPVLGPPSGTGGFAPRWWLSPEEPDHLFPAGELLEDGAAAGP